MKIYSDTLERTDLYKALGEVGGREDNWPSLYLSAITIQRPRIRSCGWNVRLEALRDSGHFRNTGTHGAEQGVRAVSWDEHGEWMARLFEIDPNARIANYDGREDFHRQTEDKYRGALV